MSQYDKEALQKLQLSGKILRETRKEIRQFVKEDMPIIEVCEKAEHLIREKGAKPAFPCNVSINEVAAHYTSPPNDTKRIPKKALVKVDIGAHVDGYVTDTAVTVCFNKEHEILVEAAEAALKNAVDNIGPDMSTARLGAIIESTIKNHGLKPISNLTGHQIGRYLIHAGTSLPNVSHLFASKIQLGATYAIEPFVTLSDAAGKVEDEKESTIFRFLKPKPQKNLHAKQLQEHIQKNFRTLPFAERWLQNVVPKEHYSSAFNQLLQSKAVIKYPVFVEASRKPVAQAEHTVLITKDGCIVLT
ncbi:MAG: type II methionyl aminopeptidase [Candidatus Bathyarchaeia archaeon]